MMNIDHAINYIPESDGRQMVKDHIARLEKALGVAKEHLLYIYFNTYNPSNVASETLKEISDIMGGG